MLIVSNEKQHVNDVSYFVCTKLDQAKCDKIVEYDKFSSLFSFQFKDLVRYASTTAFRQFDFWESEI